MEAALELPQSVVHNTEAFGIRRRRTTDTGVEDVLDLRRELTGAPSFELALRERVGRRTAFRHPSFVQVRRVERTPGTRYPLAIVSEAADGVLLCDLLEVAAERDITPPAPWALTILSQVLDSLAILHAADPAVGHGALTSQRILIDAASNALICDHVLGPAIGQLGYSAARYWEELGIPISPDAPRFDHRLDLFQMGLIGLELLGGRASHTFSPAALRQDVSALPAAGDHQALVAESRQWLGRLLQLDSTFRSALDARDAFQALLAGHAQAAVPVGGLHDWLAACSNKTVLRGVASMEAVSDRSHPEPVRTTASPVPANDSAPAPAHFVSEVPISEQCPLQPAERIAPRPADLPGPSPTQLAIVAPPAPASSSRPAFRGAVSALVLATVVVAAMIGARYVRVNGQRIGSTTAIAAPIASQARASSAVAPAGGLRFPASPIESSLMQRRTIDEGNEFITSASPGTEGRRARGSAPASPRPGVSIGTLQVRTQPAGARVSIDGKTAGRSPVTLTVTPGEHTIEVSTDSGVVTDTVAVQRDTTTSVIIPLAAARAGGAGWIDVRSPIDVHVFEGDQLIGISESRRLMLEAGAHQLDIVNEPLHYTTRRIVTVAPGKVTPITIEVPKGALAINALPWAQVWVDGELLGPTPIGNAAVAIGNHDLVFRHPQLGEQHRRVVVLADGVARMSVDMGGKR